MEEKKMCPKFSNCRLFNKNLHLLGGETSLTTYKNLFCTAGKDKYTKCKRYLVSEKIGEVADFVMPNSSNTVDEIIEKMKAK